MQYGHIWLNENVEAAINPQVDQCCCKCTIDSAGGSAAEEFPSIRLLRSMVLEARYFGVGPGDSAKLD